jgi:hypothetical protein
MVLFVVSLVCACLRKVVVIRHVDVKTVAVKEMVVSSTDIAGVTCLVPADEFYILLCLHLCVTVLDLLADVIERAFSLRS